MNISRKEYCGHWTDTDLVRTNDFKQNQIRKMKRAYEELAEELCLIHEEQNERFIKKLEV